MAANIPVLPGTIIQEFDYGGTRRFAEGMMSQVFSLALDSYTFGSTDLTTLRTPLVLPQGLWAAGFVLFGLAALALMARGLRQSVQGEWQTMDQSLMSRNDLDEANDTLQALGADTKVVVTKGGSR